MTVPAVLTGDHRMLPLPFVAGSLNGISERMITSHHENNYAGAVRNLNRTEQELAQITRDTPPLLVAALRERELTFRNSKALHEAYFGNLGGDGRRSGAIETGLGEAYGSSSRWEEHFRATGSGLGGGSGWVMLSFELDTGSLRTAWSGHHTQALATGFPLLVMDMYEHSYQMDFGAAVPRYLDAFFANVRWDEVNARFERDVIDRRTFLAAEAPGCALGMICTRASRTVRARSAFSRPVLATHWVAHARAPERP